MIVSVVTPWHDHPELIPAYEQAVAGAEVVIIDNASQSGTADLLDKMAVRLAFAKRATIHHERANGYFAAANNRGLASSYGDIVVFLNNDIVAPLGWLNQVVRDVCELGVLYGPASDLRVLAGRPRLYLEGWCIAALRATWERLGGWDAETFKYPYWEDVELSWRAVSMGMRLAVRPWPVRHLGNTTSRTTPGAYDYSVANGRALERKVLAAESGVPA